MTTGFYHGWLCAVLFWTGLSVGSAALVMIHHLTGGQWGFAIRRILEAALAPLPLMAILFLPLLLGLEQLYPWAREAAVAHDPVLQHRAVYMNPAGYCLRALLVFAIWIVLARALQRLSLRQDDSTNQRSARLRRLSGPGLVLVPVAATVAYLDWVMSLEADWYSTIFMILLCVGNLLSALCLALGLLPRLDPPCGAMNDRVRRQLGNLLLALVLLWTYLMYSQFIIIWMGNLPREISWYMRRVAGGWAWMAGALAIFHFAIPLLVLLSREAKGRPNLLSGLALLVLVCQGLFHAWVVLPSSARRDALWLAALCFPMVGGAWIWRFRAALRGSPPVTQPSPSS